MNKLTYVIFTLCIILTLTVMGIAQVRVTPVPVTGQKNMANSAPVVIASDQSAVPITLSGATVQTCALSGTTCVSLYADPCQTSAGITISGSISTSTLIAAGSAGKLYTVCSGDVYVNGTATSWALVSGSGGSAAAPTNATANWMGGTTASAGPNFIANQGIVDNGPWAKFTQASGQVGYNLYLLLSGSNQVNYNFRLVLQ